MLRSTVLFLNSFDEQNFTDMTFSKVFPTLCSSGRESSAKRVTYTSVIIFNLSKPNRTLNQIQWSFIYEQIQNILVKNGAAHWWKHPHSTIVTLVRTLRLLLEIFTSTPVTPLSLNSNTYWMQEHSFRGRGEGLLMEVKTVYKPLKVKHTLIWHNFTGLHLLNRTIYSSVDAT